jgi:hypothetical protein
MCTLKEHVIKQRIIYFLIIPWSLWSLEKREVMLQKTHPAEVKSPRTLNVKPRTGTCIWLLYNSCVMHTFQITCSPKRDANWGITCLWFRDTTQTVFLQKKYFTHIATWDGFKSSCAILLLIEMMWDCTSDDGERLQNETNGGRWAWKPLNKYRKLIGCVSTVRSNSFKNHKIEIRFIRRFLSSGM